MTRSPGGHRRWMDQHLARRDRTLTEWDRPGGFCPADNTQMRNTLRAPEAFSRRHHVGPIAARLATVFLSLLLYGQAMANPDASRTLSFFHTHTGEQLDVVYWRDGQYLTTAMEEINHFLRDFRTGDAAEMDPELLDILHEVYQRTGSRGHFEVISAYRSAKTNEMLRARSGGVAKKSQHLEGRAIDVRLTDIPISEMRTVAYDLGLGGVGFYQTSNFVHLDTGRFRTW